MNPHVKFPPSNEIKRIIAAVVKAGLQIGTVDIRTDGVTIHPPAATAGISAYDQWKAQGQG